MKPHKELKDITNLADVVQINFETAWIESASGGDENKAKTAWNTAVYHLQKLNNLVFPPQIDIEFSASDRIAAMQAEKQHFFNQVGKEME